MLKDINTTFSILDKNIEIYNNLISDYNKKSNFHIIKTISKNIKEHCFPENMVGLLLPTLVMNVLLEKYNNKVAIETELLNKLNKKSNNYVLIISVCIVAYIIIMKLF